MVIKTYSNWCEIDYLDRWSLKDGDLLNVTFKNGETRMVKAVVLDESYETSDMGHPCNIPVTRAYAKANIYGSTVKIPLSGLVASFVTEPKRREAYWIKDAD